MITAQNSKRTVLIASKAMTNTETATANLDTKRADYATININLGVEKNTDAVGPTIALLESDDTVVTNFATFDANYAKTALDLTAARQLVYHVDLRGRKRYLRLSVTTATATNDDIVVGAIAETTRLAESPATTTGMVGSTNDVVVIG